MAEITIRISDKTLKVAGLILGVLFVAWGFSYLWASGVFHPKYQVRIFLPQTGGLRVGAPVTMDGVKIGSVTKLKLAKKPAGQSQSVEVLLRIEKRFQNMIRDDSTASVLTNGLLGNRYISIQRGFTGAIVRPEGEIRVLPMKEIGFKDVISAIGKAAGRQNKGKRPPASQNPN